MATPKPCLGQSDEERTHFLNSTFPHVPSDLTGRVSILITEAI